MEPLFDKMSRRLNSTRRISRFSLSLAVQVFLVFVAGCWPSLHSDWDRRPIWFAGFCAGWDLILILDWSLCKAGLFRRDAQMHTLPAGFQILLPAIFFLLVYFV
jgi:hypothetical protein